MNYMKSHWPLFFMAHYWFLFAATCSSPGGDIAKQMPAEAKKFGQIDKDSMLGAVRRMFLFKTWTMNKMMPVLWSCMGFLAKDQPVFSIHLFDFFRPEKLQSSAHMFASPGGLAQDHAQVRWNYDGRRALSSAV